MGGRCNPAEWEGDFRLWEALLSGALVFVDQVSFWDRLPNPVVHEKHLIIYERDNKEEFLRLLSYYSEHPDEARQIGQAGKEFVLKHHMASNRIDYMLQQVGSRLKDQGGKATDMDTVAAEVEEALENQIQQLTRLAVDSGPVEGEEGTPVGQLWHSKGAGR